LSHSSQTLPTTHLRKHAFEKGGLVQRYALLSATVGIKNGGSGDSSKRVVEMTGLYINERTFCFGEGGVFTISRASDPCSLGV